MVGNEVAKDTGKKNIVAKGFDKYDSGGYFHIS
jgi:hypothetical protein